MLCALVACRSAAAPASLRYFVGDWTARAENPATKQAFTLRYTVVARDGALAGRGSSPELGLDLEDSWRIEDGVIVRTITDSSGVHAVVRGTGWDGSSLRLEGEAKTASGTFRIRETIVREGPRSFTATWEADRGAGWAAYSVERLTR